MPLIDKSPLPRPCPACSSDRPRAIGTKNGFALNKCFECGSIYSDSGEFDYEDYYNDGNLLVPDFVHGRVEAIVASFRNYLKTGNLLDIGFGAGVLLQHADGWNKFGVELSRSSVDNARPEWHAYHGRLHEAAYQDDFFDVVAASELLEHVNGPTELLTEVHRILRPGGLFWGTTPSANGLSYKLLGIKWSVITPPEHLQLFSPEAVRRMLFRAGFSTVSIRTYSFNPYEVLNQRHSEGQENGFDRVGTAYWLNEQLSNSPVRQAFKNAVNCGLNLLRLGDSLKIRAVK